jgi:predicted small secreted protein
MRSNRTNNSLMTAGWFVAAIAAILWLSACNTMEGAGEDIQDAGEAVEDAAD